MKKIIWYSCKNIREVTEAMAFAASNIRTEFVSQYESEARVKAGINCAQDFAVANANCFNGAQKETRARSQYSFSLILRGSGQSPEKKTLSTIHLLDNIVLSDTLR
nr:MAG TPA: hypothetical protein [Microviridae sp.]